MLCRILATPASTDCGKCSDRLPSVIHLAGTLAPVGNDPIRRRQRRMRGNLPGPEGLAGRGASAALHGWSVVPLRPAPRALHPLPLPANAAHAEYSDRLPGGAAAHRHDACLVIPYVKPWVLHTRARRFAVSIHVALNHVTHYRYDRLVSLSPQVVRLRPAPHCRTRILSYSLRVQPAKHFINWQQDPQANYLARLTFPDKTRELRIAVDLIAEMSVFNPFDFFLEPYAQQFPFKYEAGEQRELAPYLATLPLTPLLAGYLKSIPAGNPRTTDFLVELNMRLSRDIRYLIRMEPGVQ